MGRRVEVAVTQDKTVFFVIGRLSMCPVRYVVSVKYLGIRVSERMYCQEHLVDMKAKMMNVVCCLGRVVLVHGVICYNSITLACLLTNASLTIFRTVSTVAMQVLLDAWTWRFHRSRKVEGAYQ